MRKIMLAGMLLASLVAGAGEVAAVRADAGAQVRDIFEFRNYAKLSISEDEGKKAFLADGLCVLISKKSFEVKPGAKYRVSVRAKALGGKQTFLIIGFAPYDAQGHLLTHVNFDGVDQSLTELTRPCGVKDKVIYVKDASKWLGANRGVAFDAKADRSDIPNFNVSNSKVVKVEEVEEDDTWKLTFDYPLGIARPAGTVVRMHRFGGTYHYTKNADVMPQWNVFSGKDLSSAGFRKGTVAARALILCNYGGKGAKGRMVFDDLIVEEISGK